MPNLSKECLSRRDFLKQMSIFVAGAALLAACGPDGPDGDLPPTEPLLPNKTPEQAMNDLIASDFGPFLENQEPAVFYELSPADLEVFRAATDGQANEGFVLKMTNRTEKKFAFFRGIVDENGQIIRGIRIWYLDETEGQSELGVVKELSPNRFGPPRDSADFITTKDNQFAVGYSAIEAIELSFDPELDLSDPEAQAVAIATADAVATEIATQAAIPSTLVFGYEFIGSAEAEANSVYVWDEELGGYVLVDKTSLSKGVIGNLSLTAVDKEYIDELMPVMTDEVKNDLADKDWKPRYVQVEEKLEGEETLVVKNVLQIIVLSLAAGDATEVVETVAWESVDGVWAEAVSGPVAIAMSEYGIPQEQAEKLADLENAEFEVKTNVADGGVLVKENGQDAYYYDGQTEFLVAVDRWPVITEIERIRENQMTVEELFSDEYFAWLKYIASTLYFDDENIKDAELWRTTILGPLDGFMYNPITAPNFPGDTEAQGRAPFRRKETLAYLDYSADHKYAVVPLFLRYEGRTYPVMLENWKVDDETLMERLGWWVFDMEDSPIITNHPVSGMPSKYPDLMRAASLALVGEKSVNQAFDLLETGDPSLLSQPGLVLKTFMTTDNPDHVK